MKRMPRLSPWAFLLLIPCTPTTAQRAKATRSRPDCSQSLLATSNQALVDSLQRYLKFVYDYEIPVLVRQVDGETTHYYLTAFMATYTMKLNPPTALISVNGREALLYEEGKPESMLTRAPDCWQYLLGKYSYLLHIDKENRRNKQPPSSDNGGYFYDPVSVELVVSNQNQIRTRGTSHIPLIQWR